MCCKSNFGVGRDFAQAHLVCVRRRMAMKRLGIEKKCVLSRMVVRCSFNQFFFIAMM